MEKINYDFKLLFVYTYLYVSYPWLQPTFFMCAVHIIFLWNTKYNRFQTIIICKNYDVKDFTSKGTCKHTNFESNISLRYFNSSFRQEMCRV